jgi:hypothetical protein
MELTHSRLDLGAYDSKSPPHDIIDRQQNEVWSVAHSPIELDEQIDWRHHQKQTHVYIPLVPYLVQPEPDLALAFMFQLGCRIKVDFGRPIRRLHIVTGHPVHEIDTEQYGAMWQAQLGFGFVLQ